MPQSNAVLGLELGDGGVCSTLTAVVVGLLLSLKVKH
jgi:hypothetical protein